MQFHTNSYASVFSLANGAEPPFPLSPTLFHPPSPCCLRQVYMLIISCIRVKIIWRSEPRVLLSPGGLALDPRHFNTTNKTAKAQAWEVHHAAEQVGKQITALKPDVIVLSTPHGIAAPEDFIFYFSPTAYGTADTDNCACPPCCYNLSVTMDTVATKMLINTLKSEKDQVSFLSAFGPPGQEDVPFPLRWGEIVPLYFIKPLLNTTKVVILSQPSRRYTQSVLMIPELQNLGRHFYEIFQAHSDKVVVIISSDLAHTHLKSGPYGFSKSAEPFDEACGKWAAGVDSDQLLVTAAEFVDKALSCGYTGLVMLDGMLKAGSLPWRSHVYANLHPSYYGMMVASFLPELSN